MPKILVTGYEPFDGFVLNPSEEIVKKLQNRRIGGFDIHGVVLPLDYNIAFARLRDVIETLQPQIVLCFGQAYRGAITLERIAINAQNMDKADNYGNKPESDIILEDAPAAYFSTIDPHPIVQVLKEKGIPTLTSYHAGTYGCNWILFQLLHYLASAKSETKAIFIHLPALPEQAIEKGQVNLATMPLDIQVRAAELVIGELQFHHS